MKIQYLDGRRLERALKMGSRSVIEAQAYLNKINVFPVADSDTGINMALTLKAIVQNSKFGKNLKETLRSVAAAALSGARGNSGIIFAQYLYGLSHELPEKGALSVKHFAEGAQKAVQHLYDAILNPVEGTMITVIRDWAEALVEESQSTTDFFLLLNQALEKARLSLNDTPTKLKALADAGVVDAGASGFVAFLEGVQSFILHGSLRELNLKSSLREDLVQEPELLQAPEKYRYCTEAILQADKLDKEELKQFLCLWGDSLILAGDADRLHIHLHCNEPHKVFARLHELGELSSSKIDDMQRQYEISHARKYGIGLLTDTACDLPQEILDHYQIMQIPFGINFGNRAYIDRLGISPDQFYQMLRYDKIHPASSQPSRSAVSAALDQALQHYEEVIAVHISQKLSGIYQSSAGYAAQRQDSRLSVVDTRHLAVSQSLIVLRIARAIEDGWSREQILRSVDSWIANTHIYTDINTLKYMVRGGRVPPLTGLVAAILNLKPVVSLDKDGKALPIGKSFSRSSNMRKILAIIKAQSRSRKLWDYAIVHADAEERAHQYALELSRILGKQPAYIMPLSPVVGVHNGIGAVGIGISYE